MREYFVTGTDTEVGKTTISVALLAAAGQRGIRAACMKPAESGCPVDDQGTLLPSDAQALLAASSAGQGLDSVCLYRYREPIAPGVAAERVGQSIDFSRIQNQLDTLRVQSPGFLLVEGAGGLLVPMGQRRTIADLATQLQLPLLIVARPDLGTISHTLLTISVARAMKLEVTGFIFSCRSQPDAAFMQSNAEQIIEHSGARYLGALPAQSSLDPDQLGRAAEAHLDCSFLMA